MRMNSLVRFCLCLIGVVCYAQISPPPSGGGGASFPAATGPNQPLLSTGAGTTYAAGSYALNLGGDFTTIGQALRLVNGYSGIQTVFYPYISSFTTVGAEVVNTFTNNNIFSGTLTVGPNNFFACVGATVCLIDKTSGTGTTLLEVGTDSGGSTSAVSTQLTIRNGASQGTVNPFQINNSSGSAVFSISPTGVVTGSGFPAVSGSGITLTNPTGAAQTITMPNAASVTLARTDAGQTFTGPQTFSTEADFGGSTSGFVKIGTTNGWLLGYANSQTIQASSNGIIGFTTGAPFTNPIDTSISRFGAGVLAIGTGAQGNTSGSLYVASTAIGPSNTSPGTGTGTFLDRTATTGATTVCIGCDFASHTSATTTQVTIQAGTGQGTTVALLTPNISVTSTSVPASGYGMNLSSSNTLGFYAGGQEIIQAYTSNLIIAGTASGSSQTGSIIINNNNNHALLLQSTGTSGISSPFSNDQAVVYGPYSAGGMLIGTGQANAPITFVTNNVSRMSVSDTGVSIGTIVYNGNSPPTNSVVCYKAGGVLGYATNTSGVIGTTCN